MAKVLTAKAIEAMKPGPARREVPDAGCPALSRRAAERREVLGLPPPGRRQAQEADPRALSRPSASPRRGRRRGRRRRRWRSATTRPARSGRPARRRRCSRSGRRSGSITGGTCRSSGRAPTLSGCWRCRPSRHGATGRWRASRRGTWWRCSTACTTSAGRRRPTWRSRGSQLHRLARRRDVIPASPAAGVRMPAQLEARDRVLTDDELRLVWQAAGALSEPFGAFVRLLILTGQRRDEVARMTADELAGDLWMIPGERAKNGEPHTVPLSPEALAVLAGVKRIGAGELRLHHERPHPDQRLLEGEGGARRGGGEARGGGRAGGAGRLDAPRFAPVVRYRARPARRPRRSDRGRVEPWSGTRAGIVGSTRGTTSRPRSGPRSRRGDGMCSGWWMAGRPMSCLWWRDERAEADDRRVSSFGICPGAAGRAQRGRGGLWRAPAGRRLV